MRRRKRRRKSRINVAMWLEIEGKNLSRIYQLMNI
jgi:hypothetical protein